MSVGDGGGGAGGPAVTVLGGSGFVGSRVVKILSEKGCAVTSVSKSGKAPAWAKGEAWAKGVEWTALDLAKADDAALDAALGSAAGSALVSCVGVVGTDAAALRDGNGLANVRAFEGGKRVGIERAVFVGVASEVAECKDGLPEFFGGYFEGKEQAETAATEAAGASCMVRPTFIYGGGSFGLTPPRVNADYGSGVEQLLSLPPIKIVADALPSGLIKAGPVEKLPVGLVKVALRPPVSVEAVAGACAAAAMGEASGVLDGTAAINKVGAVDLERVPSNWLRTHATTAAAAAAAGGRLSLLPLISRRRLSLPLLAARVARVASVQPLARRANRASKHSRPTHPPNHARLFPPLAWIDQTNRRPAPPRPRACKKRSCGAVRSSALQEARS